MAHEYAAYLALMREQPELVFWISYSLDFTFFYGVEPWCYWEWEDA